MTLLEEIQAACTPEQITSRNDALITELVNASRPDVIGKVERAEFATWAASSGMRSKIEDASNDPASPLRDAALGIKDVLIGAASSIDLSIRDNLAILDAWVSFGQCSVKQCDELLLLATRPATQVSTSDISEVLNGGI